LQVKTQDVTIGKTDKISIAKTKPKVMNNMKNRITMPLQTLVKGIQLFVEPLRVFTLAAYKIHKEKYFSPRKNQAFHTFHRVFHNVFPAMVDHLYYN
jgi:hypothetical protein